MADRFCPSCGTEVDADARFCPSCGRTLDVDEAVAADQADPGLGGGEQPTRAIPPAPSWPPPGPAADRDEDAGEAAGDVGEAGEEPAPPPPPPPAPEAAAQPPDTVPAGESSEPDLPFTWPTTLSGWMMGAGSFFGALSLLPRLGNLLDLILFVALLAVSAAIFLADRMPRIDRQRMLSLVVLMVALGVALDRSAFTVPGVHTIFLVAMLIAAGGALLIELDRDRPLPPPSGLR